MLEGVTILETVSERNLSTFWLILIIILGTLLLIETIYAAVIDRYKKKKKVGPFAYFLALSGIIIGLVSVQTFWIEHSSYTTTHTITIDDSVSYLNFSDTYQIISEEENGNYVVQEIEEIEKNEERKVVSGIWCLTLLGGWFLILMYWLGIESLIKMRSEKDEKVRDQKDIKRVIGSALFIISVAALGTYGLIWLWQNIGNAPFNTPNIGSYQAIDPSAYPSLIDGVSIVGVVDAAGDKTFLRFNSILFVAFTVWIIVDSIKEVKALMKKMKEDGVDKKKRVVLWIQFVSAVILPSIFIAASGLLWSLSNNIETCYIATIDQSVSFNEFVDCYDVLETEGELYKIVESTKVNQ